MARGLWTFLCVLAILLRAACASAPDAAEIRAPDDPRQLATHTQQITDAVLKYHLDPPARQQMILNGIKGLYRAAGGPLPAGLSRRVSSVTTPDGLSALLVELWPPRKAPSQSLGNAFVAGLLEGIPGGAEIVSAKEHEVQEQFGGNRYVGIHIQVRYDDKEKRTIIAGIVPGGPADRAGMKVEDRIEQVDGANTTDMKIAQVVDRLRGPDGSDVSVTVRQPGAKAARTLKATRGKLFIPTITGVRSAPSGAQDYRLRIDGSIAYLKMSAISASTPRELRQLAEEIEHAGTCALVIDLRGTTSMDVHSAVLLADALLDQGRIGQVQEAERVMTYEATPDALFQGWPLAVLVDGETSGTAEWLAATLQDNHRASIVGSPTQSAQTHRRPESNGSAIVRSSVPVGDGLWFLTLATGRLEHGDGRPLAVQPQPGTADGLHSLTVGGVQPDLRISPGKSIQRRQAQDGPRPFFDRGLPLDPWSDAALNVAVEYLQARLKHL